MFNNYVEMLKKATEAMTSLHHTEAGPAEYFSAVGYEFAVIGLGILWLAIIVAVIAIPIVITKWVLNGKFATRKWKKFCSIWKDAKAIIKQRNDLEVDFRFSILHDVNDVVNTIFSFYQQHCGKDRVKPFIDAAAKLSAKKLWKYIQFEDLTNLYSKSWEKSGVFIDKKDKINIFMTGLGVEKPDDHDYDLIVNSDYIDLKEDAKKIFTDVGEYKKEKKINHIMTNVYLILLYAVYAIFLIPLILIFIYDLQIGEYNTVFKERFMLVKLVPGLEKYAMDSSNVTLLLLVVFASIVIKDIFEQKKLLKEYEAFWIYPIISVILLIGIALSPDITSDLFMILELLCSVKMGALQYELNKKSRNRMGSCAIYILILPDNTVIVEKPMYENEMQLSGCIFYNPESKKYETYGTVSDKTLAKVRNNEPDLYKKIVNNEPVNAQDYPLSCVWESNIPKEHDELLQYIIEECVYLYSDQLIEFGEYMDKETNIIFQLYGKRNDAVSITLNEYFQHYR